MIAEVSFTLAFSGAEADQNRIDFYDVSQALIGFQRSIALTTHLVLNNEIITQSPSLKGAKIYALPPEIGSWKMTAAIFISTGIYTLGTTENNSPIGHIIYSLYDYVISESLGVHMDYNKSLGQLYEEAKEKKAKLPEIKESQADSLIEKCSTAIREMHRPIYKLKTATTGSILGYISGEKTPLRAKLTLESYEFINETRIADRPEKFAGRISSYNSNTFKGRIYISEIGRPVSFELAENARTENEISLITSSLRANALKDYSNKSSTIYCLAFRNTSKSGHLKGLTIIKLSSTLIT